jgi:two-component system chemotaxis response regulator CheB
MGKIEFFAMGGSAGALEALRKVVSMLPKDFPPPICVVLHTAPESPGLIPEILSSLGPIPAQHAKDGEAAEGGRIYVAPPDCHLIVDRQRRLRLGRGAKENRFRPAIDPLFRSAAIAFEGSAGAIVLSGGLDDGVAGAVAVKERGGAVIVQDPSDAEAPSMPAAALRALKPDRRVPAIQIAQAMTDMAREYVSRPAKQGQRSGELEKELSFAMGADHDVDDIRDMGKPSSLTCPECHGAMIQLQDAIPRFRCRTGHAFSLESLAATQHQRVEDSLWNAIRALEEQAALLQRFARHLNEAGGDREKILYEAKEAQWRSRLVRDAVRSKR